MSKTCPLCAKPTDPQYAPFCSRHCSDLDLHRWLSGRYAIPAAEQDASEDEDQAGRDEG